MESVEVVVDPVQSARDAGLRYVYDSRPGIGRKKAAKGFRYVGTGGMPVRDKETLGRIKSLAIPPAWEDVWICSSANGHLQATGRDAKGRKQSRYHPRWREVRDEAKYERMMAFGKALPAIRARVDHDLKLPGLPRLKVLATIVRLLETTFIRVGNEEYARENKSYGLTTMRNKHVNVDGSTVTFAFSGKSGVKHSIDVNDRRLAKIVKRCLDVPGYELFQYVDHDGMRHSLDSGDVNEYLREISGEHFTAKDFRTWAGTVLACMMLREFEAFETERQAKTNVVRAIESVAEKLGNTPSVCRKCYVHPAVLECYLSGSMRETVKQRVEQEIEKHELRQEEVAVMGLLQERLG
ncbi:DNA topoisomerase IB [Granulicella sibirica]|uniref:DNA topoisomerase n=1 Tax=Granulicella sibirica TaxID=2479048 RepID=A0A4Q0SY27_9BACT|nr:DNA topoisomerase IB [Granulicella sibirica]RXH55767.1 DNA topoisomerase IB (poxvirus type) [Granulicella sibirica]